MMQAIVETLFDAVYLILVITIGVLMIRGSRENSQFRLFGWMAIVLGAGDSFHLIPRAVALCTTGLENYTVPLGIGKWITSVTMTVFYVLLYYVWSISAPNYRKRQSDCCSIWIGRSAGYFVYAAAESVAECRSASFLGNMP